MDATKDHEWFGLHDFEDPVLARDVITSILSMEFDALLVDLSDDSVVAGGMPAPPDGELVPLEPIEITPQIGGFVSRLDPTQVSKPDPRLREQFEARRLSLEGGPWRLMVSEDSRDQLQPLLHTIIEEQQQFDLQHERQKLTQLRFLRYCFLIVLVSVALFALLRVLGII
ncbi:MAG: hypothetical protein CBC35_11975 [Planctomycetes bacterium TMED75]|nr:hypothetical protein [Planctomycetaceae bacterium]OUU90447.1 MAG: hypothetical protein CBC35_11975 [Planctomycetes bacterium TMED75]